MILLNHRNLINPKTPSYYSIFVEIVIDDKIITYVGTFSFHFGHKFFFWKRSNRREGLLATASGLPKSHPWPLTCVRLILTFAFLNNKDKDKDKVKVPPLNSYVGPPHLNLCILKQFKAPWVRSYRHTLLGQYEVESPEAFWTVFLLRKEPQNTLSLSLLKKCQNQTI